MAQGYSSAVEGGRPVRLRYAIEGRMDMSAYAAFVAERARWLDIAGWIETVGPGRATMVAAGPEALVGALEMACTLGPLEALVDRLEGVETAEAVGAEFVIR